MGREIVERKDGRKLARTTVYFNQRLYRRLRLLCAKHDLVISEVVGNGLERYLDMLEGKTR